MSMKNEDLVLFDDLSTTNLKITLKVNSPFYTILIPN
jgi:hypothetical protein